MAGRILGRVGVVEIRDLLVPLRGPRPAQVRPRHEGAVASHLEFGLEDVGEDRVPPVSGAIGVRRFTRKTETERVPCGGALEVLRGDRSARRHGVGGRRNLQRREPPDRSPQ